MESDHSDETGDGLPTMGEEAEQELTAQDHYDIDRAWQLLDRALYSQAYACTDELRLYWIITAFETFTEHGIEVEFEVLS